MKQHLQKFLMRTFPRIVSIAILLGSLIFLASFLLSTWRAIGATETVLTLKNTVAMESLDRARFDRVLKNLKEKIADRAIDWQKLHDPF
ncbi:MAG: hypothetical protein Q7S16_00205 [bacterium]|nr:hypothetical protein [bacterium]